MFALETMFRHFTFFQVEHNSLLQSFFVLLLDSESIQMKVKPKPGP